MIKLTQLNGVGAVVAKKLATLGLITVQDALWYLPYRYQDRSKITPIADLQAGNEYQIEGVIKSTKLISSRTTIWIITVKDASAEINLCFFNFSRAQQQLYSIGMKIRCYGEVKTSDFGLNMFHPECTIINKSNAKISPTLTPIYPLTQGLSQFQMRKIMHQVIDGHAKDCCINIMPPDLRGNWSLFDAVNYVHNPPANADVEQLTEFKHPAQKRIIFEELLASQLVYNLARDKVRCSKAFVLHEDKKLKQQFISNLGFNLTNAQKKVSAQISNDLTQTIPMMRLVQGDVGSGKTVVAALAALQAIANGLQVALMAPTEILAEQHYLNFASWFSALNIEVTCLMSKLKTAEKRGALAKIASGIPMVIGTHALFQEQVTFKNLALVIIDEQHRFGVQQRMQLSNKGTKSNTIPHQLIMTATPIPRTLTMSVYADLDTSIIDELPPNRTPVKTIVISNKKRQKIIERVSNACAEGKQVYWVCSLIEESEKLNCEAAITTFQNLQKILPNITIDLIHGRMKAEEKKAIMAKFKQGITQMLVATTVIEVGVDVPNASLMIIDNAERLGLSQLHQLRGRVGRGSVESFCVLMYQDPLAQISEQRLDIMRNTNDGFIIAEQDLKLRGPGEILGVKQAGNVTFKVADLMRDYNELRTAYTTAKVIHEKYPKLIAPLLNRWISNANQYINA